MRLYLKQRYIHKEYGWSWKELENFEKIFENFEIITDEDSDNKRVGYLLAYTDKSVKIIYVDKNGDTRTKYIPISAIAVVDSKASLLTQCLLYRKLNDKKQQEHSNILVKECLKYATTWCNGYVLDRNKYI